MPMSSFSQRVLNHQADRRSAVGGQRRVAKPPALHANRGHGGACATHYRRSASPTCLVHFNRYSMSASFAYHPDRVKAYPDRIVVVAEGQAVCKCADHRAVT